MNNLPLISIITINYKQAKVTNQLLKSLDKVNYSNLEIILVDNNSGYEDLRQLETNRPNLVFLSSKKNLGFAGGNNIGIKAAKGEYIILLNNDTEVEPDFINYLLEVYRVFPRIGAVSPKIKFYSNPDTIQYAGFTKMNPITLRMKAIGNKQKDKGLYDNISETEFMHGCAVMIPKQVIEEVGFMHEGYFLYYEEHDWSSAIKRAGYKIYYQPNSVVYHKESISVQKNSPLKTYFINRNRILFMRRNLKSINRTFAWIYLVFISFPKNFISYINNKEHLKAYIDAIIWNVTHKTKAKWNL